MNTDVVRETSKHPMCREGGFLLFHQSRSSIRAFLSNTLNRPFALLHLCRPPIASFPALRPSVVRLDRRFGAERPSNGRLA